MSKTLKLLLAASLLTVSLFSAEGKKKAEKESPKSSAKEVWLECSYHTVTKDLLGRVEKTMSASNYGRNAIIPAYFIITTDNGEEQVFGYDPLYETRKKYTTVRITKEEIATSGNPWYVIFRRDGKIERYEDFVDNNTLNRYVGDCKPIEPGKVKKALF
jgi:hypothetical protein